MTFEDGDDAERYGNLLEADGHVEVYSSADDPPIFLRPVCRDQSLNEHVEICHVRVFSKQGRCELLHRC